MSPFEPKKFGRYLLIDKLAVGGMAEIYKAKTYGVDGFEKLLAIKRILPHCAADKDFINMLVDEAKLTVLLSHANIVQVYDLGKVGDDYYISMEFIHGTNMRELLRRIFADEGKVAQDIAVYIVSEICKGLDYAHRKTDPSGTPLNIVHRDVNPQNILISYEGEVKLVDFGIAKAAMNVSHTMAGVLKGKIAYMSPEQSLGKPLDGGTDIYSVGLVLYEMLTGEKFYTGETQFEILNKIRTTHINLNDLPDYIPGPLKEILSKALAYNQQDRYQTAGDMHLDLTKYLYSSYIDFSPRQLASLVQQYFANEMAATEELGPAVDEKTRSLLIQAEQGESLVAEEEAGLAKEETTGTTARQPKTEEEVSEPSIEKHVASAVVEKKKRGIRPAFLALALIAAVSGGLYYGWTKFAPPADKAPEPEPTQVTEPVPTEPVVEYGSIVVSSEPSEAQILLNGEKANKTTPATLLKLPLGEDYTVTAQKEHYKPAEKTVAMVSTDPVKVHVRLEALPDGMLQVSSDPEGAQIFVNGKDSGKVTPAAIDSLEIKKDYTIQLKKEGFNDWTTKVPLKNFDPVTIHGSLAALPKPPPQPAAEVKEEEAEPKEEEKVEEPKIELGTLAVSSTPSGAKIYLNGEKTDLLTPAELPKLEFDKFYTIDLFKDGYESWTRSVKVTKDGDNKLVASLKPYGETTPTPVEKPKTSAPAPAPSPTPTTRPAPSPAPAPAPAPTVARGSLTVNSSPSGAEVYVNGQYKGTAPLTVANVPAGTAQVKVQKYGYMPYQGTASIRAGENKNLGTIKLGGLYGEIKVESNPPRAKVIFDGREIGARTPVTIRQVQRDKIHTLRVELDGFRAWQTNVDLRSQTKRTYKAELPKM